jgi:hypothetical protein
MSSAERDRFIALSEVSGAELHEQLIQKRQQMREEKERCGN